MQLTTPISTPLLVAKLIEMSEILRERYEDDNGLEGVAVRDLAMLRSRMQGAACVAMETLAARGLDPLSLP